MHEHEEDSEEPARPCQVSERQGNARVHDIGRLVAQLESEAPLPRIENRSLSLELNATVDSGGGPSPSDSDSLPVSF